MCFGQRYNLYDNQHIDYDNFIKILDKLNPTFIRLWGRGETLLHPRFDDILIELKKRKIKTVLTTNLNVKNLNFSLIKETISEIYVSLHSFEDETYKNITENNNSNVLSNILKLKESNIVYYLKMIVSKYNENEINEFINICCDLECFWMISGVDFGPGEITDDDLRNELIEELYPITDKAKIYNRYLNQNLEIRNHKTCESPNIPHILYNGSMYSCCIAAKSGYIGNVFEENFKIDYDIINKMKSRESNECKECPIF